MTFNTVSPDRRSGASVRRWSALRTYCGLVMARSEVCVLSRFRLPFEYRRRFAGFQTRSLFGSHSKCVLAYSNTASHIGRPRGATSLRLRRGCRPPQTGAGVRSARRKLVDFTIVAAHRDSPQRPRDEGQILDSIATWPWPLALAARILSIGRARLHGRDPCVGQGGSRRGWTVLVELEFGCDRGMGSSSSRASAAPYTAPPGCRPGRPRGTSVMISSVVIPARGSPGRADRRPVPA